MSRRVGAVCAGLLLAAVAGCSFDSFLVPFGGPRLRHQVVAGPVGEVADRLEAALSEAGIPVLTKQHGRELRVAGMTKAGKVFCVHLSQENGEGEERTRITVQWDRDVDEEFWWKVVEPLALPTGEPSAPRHGPA
jgi:hypothetical protein